MSSHTVPVGTFSGIRFMDQDDLMSFSGAEDFAFGGQPPVIYENSDRLIVAGRNGVEVMFGDHDLDRYVLARDQMTMSEAIAVIEMISHASRIALKAVGFTIGR